MSVSGKLMELRALSVAKQSRACFGGFIRSRLQARRPNKIVLEKRIERYLYIERLALWLNPRCVMDCDENRLFK